MRAPHTLKLRPVAVCPLLDFWISDFTFFELRISGRISDFSFFGPDFWPDFGFHFFLGPGFRILHLSETSSFPLLETCPPLTWNLKPYT